jgi:hypothetical protein
MGYIPIGVKLDETGKPLGLQLVTDFERIPYVLIEGAALRQAGRSDGDDYVRGHRRGQQDDPRQLTVFREAEGICETGLAAGTDADKDAWEDVEARLKRLR